MMDLLPFSLERPWILLPLAVAIYWTLRVARSSLAGQPPEVARITTGLRILLLVLLALSLGGFSLVHRGEGVTVLVLRDLSASVPAEEGDRIVRLLSERATDLDSGDRVGLIAFGRNAGEEQPPTHFLRPGGTPAVIDREGTDLAGALRLADSVFTSSQADGGRRVVLISDGNATEGDEFLEAQNLATTGAVIDVIPVEYFHDRELLVESLRLPSEVHPEEPYTIEAVIDSDLPGDATVQLYENDRLVEERTVDLAAGKNRVDFARRQQEQGRYQYRMQVFPGPERDSLPGNNVGYGFTLVHGEPRVLLVGDAESHTELIDALASARIACEVRAANDVPLDTQQYLAYSAIVLSDVSAYQLGPDTLERMHGVVRNLGVGLLMIGGPDSFGAGGYRGTPIERALPVEMDVRQRKTIPNGALAIVLHTCEFPQGNMWAKQIASSAIEALTPEDYAGVLVFDGLGADRWGVPLQLVRDRAGIVAKIRSLQPWDMPSFAPTMRLGLAGLQGAPAVSKHMIILSDGDPAPPTAQTMQGFVDAGISVSTICIQPHGGRDTGVMRKIALDTGGRYYRADDPRLLPQIFFREAIQVRRNLILEETFTPRIASVTDPIRGLEQVGFPTLDGYVITTAKPLAEVALVSHQDDPVLATWRYGLGRTAAFTSDSGERWAAGWVGWEGYETFWAQLVRSISRRGGSEFLEVTHSVEGGQGNLTIDAIDGEGRFIDGLDLEGRILDPSLGEQIIRFQQLGPGRYQAAFDATNAGSYLLAVSYDGQGIEGTTTSGFSVSYPREYRYLRSDFERLTKLAEMTGGRVLTPADDLFDRDLPIRREKQSIWEELLQIALLLFFLDIVLRRVAVNWTALLRPLGGGDEEEPALAGAGGPVVAGTVRPRTLQTGTATGAATEDTPEGAPATPAAAQKESRRSRKRREKREAADPGFTSQLLEAKKRARQRNEDRSRDDRPRDDRPRDDRPRD